MTRFALSTMYAQTPRFEDGAVFARFAAEAGYDAVEISHSTPAAKVGAIAAANILPITSIHQPAPWEMTPGGVPNADLNLADLSEKARGEAVAAAMRSVDLAIEVGAKAVVLHLGHIGPEPAFDEDTAIREAYAVGIDPVLRSAVMARRDDVVQPYLEAARRSIRELSARAAPAEVVLGVESRLNFREIPLPAELPFLLDGLDAEFIGYWHDVGHAEILDRLGYAPLADWFAQPGVRVVGAHVHDVTAVLDHRAPGSGDIDWSRHLPALTHLDSLTFEINQFEPDEAVVATPTYIRERLNARS